MKLKKVFLILIITVILMMVALTVIVLNNISAPSKESNPIVFEVTENDTYNTLGDDLLEAGLIKNEVFYKLFVRLMGVNNLQVGFYDLNQNMDLKTILNTLDGNSYAETFKIVVPEGYHIDDIAGFISESTDYSSEEILRVLTDKTFINDVINDYWFVTDEVLNINLKYSLEGYLFPATYDINMGSSIEDIIYTMLNKTDEVLSKYKNEIDASGYSVHEILTFASIVEYEAGSDEQRATVAGVFKNRLELNMLLQSCATVGYAIGEWKYSYTYADLAYDSLYNTYMYLGLPIGPGNSPGEGSIAAVLNPEEHNYLYFVANIHTKETYFSETYAEHQQNCIDKLGVTC